MSLKNCSIKKATAARIMSHVCSARKEMACPAALKIKLTIRPGRIEPTFLSISCKPFTSVFRVCYRAYNSATDSPVCTDDSRDGEPIILKDFSFSFSSAMLFFSLCNLCSEPCKRLFTFSLLGSLTSLSSTGVQARILVP